RVLVAHSWPELRGAHDDPRIRDHRARSVRRPRALVGAVRGRRGGRRSMKRVSIDVGGTFPDGLVLSEDGSLESFKSPTTPAEPESGILRCLERAAEVFA